MSAPTESTAAQPANSDKDLDSSTSTSIVNPVEPPATSHSKKNEVAGEDEVTKDEASKEREAKDEDGPRRSPVHTALIMTALCLAVFLAALDSVIITTALPTMSRDLDASDTEFAWIGSSYLLANAASSPFWGKVSDIFGRKSILIIANVVFLVGSIVCALAYDLPMMLAGRTVQGLGGGGLITLVEIAVGDLFSQRCVTIHPASGFLMFTDVFQGARALLWCRGRCLGHCVRHWPSSRYVLMHPSPRLNKGTDASAGGAFTEKVTWRWCFWSKSFRQLLNMQLALTCRQSIVGLPT